MSFPQPHIIRRQTFNVHSTGDEDGVRLQQETEQLYRTHILPGLERLLDRYDTGDAVISIDKLSVSLKDIKREHINNSLAQQILDEVEKQLRQSVQKASGMDSGRFTAEERLFQSWIHYLQHGYLPWWANVKDDRSWQERLELLIQDIPVPLLRTLTAYLDNMNVTERITAQLNDTSFRLFFRQLTGWNNDNLRSLFEDENIMAPALSASIPQRLFRSRFRQLLLSVVNRPGTKQEQASLFAVRLVAWLHTLPGQELYTFKTLELHTEEIKSRLQKDIDAPAETAEILKPAASADDKEISLPEEGIYINNAGVVLVAPYLSSFFARAGLVQENVVTDPQRAVGILQYMIAGDAEYAEFEMVLPKLLCGIEPETLVADGYHVTGEEKELVDELLGSVIGNWEALKNTSVDGFRNAFLRREGKLHFNKNTWRLYVQEQSYDILLDYLPWSISMIRLPWMPYLLQVDWR